MGAFEVPIPVGMEATVEYHPDGVLNLTLVCYESKRRLTIDEPEQKFVMVLNFSKSVLVIHTRPGTVPGG